MRASDNPEKYKSTKEIKEGARLNFSGENYPSLVWLRFKLRTAFFIRSGGYHLPNHNKDSENTRYKELHAFIKADIKKEIGLKWIVKILTEEEELGFYAKNINTIEEFITHVFKDYTQEEIRDKVSNYIVSNVPEISIEGEDSFLQRERKRLDIKLTENKSSTIEPLTLIGAYDLFFSGSLSKIYDRVYHDDLLFDGNGTVTISNPFTQKVFSGTVKQRGTQSLQILSYDDSSHTTMGMLVTFNLSGYSPITKELSGLMLSFDAQEIACCYPAFLSPKGRYHRKHPFILKLFEQYKPYRYKALTDEDIIEKLK